MSAMLKAYLTGLALGCFALAGYGAAVWSYHDERQRTLAALAEASGVIDSYLSGEVQIKLARHIPTGDVFVQINEAKVYEFKGVCPAEMSL